MRLLSLIGALTLCVLVSSCAGAWEKSSTEADSIIREYYRPEVDFHVLLTEEEVSKSNYEARLPYLEMTGGLQELRKIEHLVLTGDFTSNQWTNIWSRMTGEFVGARIKQTLQSEGETFSPHLWSWMEMETFRLLLLGYIPLTQNPLEILLVKQKFRFGAETVGDLMREIQMDPAWNQEELQKRNALIVGFKVVAFHKSRADLE